ncbi:hypothetical protein LPN04_31340 [Rugamonas sp. A1-17]|nr:hypothetical protein [Rugamonas sp. A1-17]
MIDLFLGDADLQTRPGHRSGRPARLYCVSRILQAESNNEEFQAELDMSRFHASRSQRRIEAKRETLLSYVALLPMPALVQPYTAVLSSARNANVLHTGASPDRVALDYLLGTMNSLGLSLNIYASHPGVRDAREALRIRILKHIREHYPMLSAEVDLMLVK